MDDEARKDLVDKLEGEAMELGVKLGRLGAALRSPGAIETGQLHLMQQQQRVMQSYQQIIYERIRKLAHA